MAIIDLKEIMYQSKIELSEDALKEISGGVNIDLAKIGIGSGNLEITPQIISGFSEAELAQYANMFAYLGPSLKAAGYVDALFGEYDEAKLDMPEVLKQALLPFKS